MGHTMPRLAQVAQLLPPLIPLATAVGRQAGLPRGPHQLAEGSTGLERTVASAGLRVRVGDFPGNHLHTGLDF